VGDIKNLRIDDGLNASQPTKLTKGHLKRFSRNYNNLFRFYVL